MKSSIFQAAFGSSRILRRMIWAGYGGLSLLFVLYFDGWRLGLLLGLCGAAAVYALREPKKTISCLNVRRNQIWLTVNGDDVAAVLDGSSLIHRYGCFLHWRTENGDRLYQCVLPDMLPPDDFRRLRVWARFARHDVSI